MQSKTTFIKIKKAFKSTALALGFLSLFTGLANAQTYTNGPLSTGANLSNGTAAPAGYTWSELPTAANTTFGSSHSIDAGFSIIDNFTVTGSWSVTSMSFFGYSTGYASTTVSPFNRVFVRIYNTDPAVGNPTPVFGDLTTNRFSGSSNTFIYRVNRATAATDRRIWQVDATVNVSLPAGNYWVEYQLGTTTANASNFGPPVTFQNQAGAPGGNARQRTIAGGAIAALTDAGVGQDHPFVVNYTTAPCSGTPAPGNTVASAASVCTNIPFSLSLQNPTSGSGVTYQWQSGPSATGPWTNIAGATSSTYSTTATATAFYQAIVTCSGNSGTSTPVQVAITQCYCTAGATSTAFEKISNVTFGTINNNSTSTAGYEDFTTVTTNAFQGAAMPISVSLSGGFAADRVMVWIDLNRDFDFDDAGELVYTSANGVGPHTGNVIIPATATLGSTRMRVRMYDTSLGPNATPCGTSTYGQVEDYTVNIVPCVPITVTTQPANRSVACAGNTTFTVALAGSLPAVYWQYRTSATAQWQNVINGGVYSGANTTTLTLTTVPSTMNGYQYRGVFSGACNGADFTSAATLTVTPLVATVQAPLPINRCISDAPTRISITNLSGGTATASTASGTLHTLIPDNNDQDVGQNNNAINHTINVTNIPAGAAVNGVRVRLNLTHSWVGDMILVLRAPDGKIISLDYALSGTGGAGPTTGFTNTVISSSTATGVGLLSAGANPYTGTFRMDNAGPTTPGFTPTGPAGFDPNTTVISDMFQGNGQWTLAMYDYYGDFTTANFLENWEISIDYGASATGVFTPSTGLFTDPAGTVAYTGTAINTVYANPAASTTYSLVVTTPTCTSAALSIPVNVGTPLSGTSTVNNAATCEGGNAAFKATAPTGGANRTYQWQESADAGASWTNVANGTHYAGATTDSLTILAATSTMNNNRYRVVITVAACSSTLTSAAGTLTVNALPILTVSANPYTAIYPGQTTTLAVASSTTVPANGYQWYRNGVAIAGATSNTLVVDVDGLGEYTVTANDANACGSANTPSITITEAPNSLLFIYPSPNSGQFQVRYYSANGNTVLPRVVNIYDSKGARIYSSQYPVTVPYARMDVDISRFSAGIYLVELLDNHGNRIKTGRVLIQK